MYPEINIAPSVLEPYTSITENQNPQFDYLFQHGTQIELWLRLLLLNEFIDENEAARLLDLSERNPKEFSSDFEQRVSQFSITWVTNALADHSLDHSWSDILFEQNHGFNVCTTNELVDDTLDVFELIKEGRAVVVLEYDCGLDRVWKGSGDFSELIRENPRLAECIYWILTEAGYKGDILNETDSTECIWYFEDMDFSQIPEQGIHAPFEEWEVRADKLLGEYAECVEDLETLNDDYNLFESIINYKQIKDFIESKNKIITSGQAALMYFKGQPDSELKTWAVQSIQAILRMNENPIEYREFHSQQVEIETDLAPITDAQYLCLSNLFNLIAQRHSYGDEEPCATLLTPKPEAYIEFDRMVKNTIVGHAIIANCPFLTIEPH